MNIPTKIAREIEHEVLMQCVRDIEMCIPYLKSGYETFPVIGDKNVVTEKFFRDAIGYLAFATSEETAEKSFPPPVERRKALQKTIQEKRS